MIRQNLAAVAWNIKRTGKHLLRTFAPKAFDRLATKPGTMEFSIGIFQGVAPLTLVPHAAVVDPILSRLDIADLPADFVADPFVVRHDSRWFMFFEAFSRIDFRGLIGLATSQDGLQWTYERAVLREPFHLTYLIVFELKRN